MFDKLKTLAHDKALHAIGGSLVAMVAAALTCLVRPGWAWWVAIVVAAVTGKAIEWHQKRANAKAGVRLHDVSLQDIAATAAGAIPVAVPLLVLALRA